MSAKSLSASPKQTALVGSHFSVKLDVESGVETPMDDEVRGKEIAVHSFNPKVYRCSEVWLFVLQFDEVQNSLRAVS